MRLMIATALVFFLSIITTAAFVSWDAASLDHVSDLKGYTVNDAYIENSDKTWVPLSSVTTSGTTHELIYVHEVTVHKDSNFDVYFDSLSFTLKDNHQNHGEEMLEQSHEIISTNETNVYHIVTTLIINAPENQEQKEALRASTGISFNFQLNH